ncbi:hypothetical protein KIL84_013725 [Mauremys mutica]|uniref:Uncharacterized protein n=1 Tax=Mauremys mutica TaxID=74926 RepID=A0A9D3WY70_9SAUR|nr:hypothetical protein KIL84_013725 [Mauremys mutica]
MDSSNGGLVTVDSTVKNIEVTAMEEEEYIGQDVSNNDTSDADDNFDDTLTEEMEDKQWILKGTSHLISSFHCHSLRQSSTNESEDSLDEKKEQLIIDPLRDEMRYERTCLRNWR